MKWINVLACEWKHFVRSPFKIVALVLWVLAALYGLHNGASLYEKQRAEIGKIEKKVAEQRQKVLAYYEKGEKGPTDRPWVDVTTPFWAMWNLPSYHFKAPSPAMVYSIGQAEQYGFYKALTVWSSPYDADMAEEIANPERLQAGTLDFAFAALYLLPLLLLVMLYNLKGTEAEQGFLPLIEVQATWGNGWLLARAAFYLGLLAVASLLLIAYGAALTGASAALPSVLGLSWLYLIGWAAMFCLILSRGRTVLGNTLQMVGLWLLFTFIVPATVHQWVSAKHPVNLMTDLIDVQRDGREKIFAQPDTAIDRQVFELFPQVRQSPLAQDSTRKKMARNFSASGLVNHLVKASILPIAEENQAKNQTIRLSYVINPVTLFQNQFNGIAQTHYQDYEAYRQQIQQLIDKRIGLMVADIWNDVRVDKRRYLQYEQQLSGAAGQ